MSETTLCRRGLLTGALAIGGAALLPGRAWARTTERRLAFRNVHTNERVDARYFANGRFDPSGIAELNHGLRDWRSGQTAPMDPNLYDLLADLRETLDLSPRRSFDLISGYRSPHTNMALREAGGTSTGVATKSQHVLGKATDIAIPGVPLDRVRLAALGMKRGGVGFYPKDGFVHVDTGRVRSW